MQDLVGIGVADACEETRIGEGALQRVVLPDQPFPKCSQISLHYFDASRVHGVERCLPSTTCSEARRLVPASVKASTPLSNSNSASVMRAGAFLLPSIQRSRPAIMRCSTR